MQGKWTHPGTLRDGCAHPQVRIDAIGVIKWAMNAPVGHATIWGQFITQWSAHTRLKFPGQARRLARPG